MKKFLLAVFLFWSFSAYAQTTIKISALPEDTSVAGSDSTITLDRTVMVTKQALWSNVFAGLIPNSAALASFISNETGTGFLVFSNSPVLVTPNIGNATGSITGNAGTATALAATPSTCQAGYAAGGILPSGNATGCFDVATQNELDAFSLSQNAAGFTDYGTTVGLTSQTDNVGIGTITASGTVEIVRTAGVTPLMVSSSAAGDGDYLIITSTGNIGINSTNPSRFLDLATPNNNAIRAVYVGASGPTNSARIIAASNDGAANGIGDKLGEFLAAGNTGSGDLYEASGIYSKTEEAWSATNRGAGLYFDVTANGATSRNAKMVLSNGGNLGIGTIVPTSVLSIIKSSTFPYLKISSAASQTGDVMLISSAGNIGVGTLTPLNIVHVNGDVRIGSGTFSQTSGNPDLYTQGNIQFGGQIFGDGSQLSGISALSAGGWTDGGSNVYQTTTTDFVGIGTTSPTTTLEIVKQSTSAPLMISATATGDGDVVLVNSSGNVGIGTVLPSNKFEVFGTAAATSLVGIGTTAGVMKLAEAKANGANYVAFKAPESLAGDVTWTLPSADSSGCFSSDGSGTVTLTTCGGGAAAAGWTDGGTNIYTTTTTDTVGIGTTGASATLEIVQQGSAAPFMVSSTPTGDGNRLIITSSGNVGIGTVTPNGPFVVNGAGNFLGTGNTIIAQGNVAIGTTTPTKLLTVGSTGQFTVASTGNVGIGTATTRAALDVNGSGDNYLGANVGIGSTAPRATLDIGSGTLGVGIGTTTAGTILCVKSITNSRAILGYCTGSLTNSICGTCN